MKTIEQTYRERLKMLVEEFGGRAELSKAIGKSVTQISQWINASPDSKTGKPRSLKSDTAREIEKAVGKPFAWFDQPVQEIENLTVINKSIPDGYIEFDVLNVEAKLGAGLLREHSHIEVVDVVTVAESWAKKHLGNNLSKIKIITARGDSMKGTIEDGEVLFVDESVTYYDGEGVYVVYAPDGLKAKRLQMLMTGDLKIISDNPKYEPEVISKKDLDCIQICGKVKGSWALSEF